MSLEFNHPNNWDAVIADGTINLQMHFDSEHPTIKCEGHFIKRVRFVFTLDSGWSDELCPDYDLSQMDMTIKLVPVVEDGALTIGSAQVDVLLTPADVQSELIASFRDLSGRYSTKIAQKVRDRLLDPDNRKNLGSVLTKLLRNQFPHLGTIQSSQINGSDWVIRYTRARRATPSAAGLLRGRLVRLPQRRHDHGRRAVVPWVPKRGLEPRREYSHYALNVARLPIPPLRPGGARQVYENAGRRPMPRRQHPYKGTEYAAL